MNKYTYEWRQTDFDSDPAWFVGVVGFGYQQQVAECFLEADAKLICDLLNSSDVARAESFKANRRLLSDALQLLNCAQLAVRAGTWVEDDLDRDINAFRTLVAKTAP